MGWWNPFKAIAKAVVDVAAAVIEGVSAAFGEPELGKKIAGVFEAVADTVVDVAYNIAVGVITSTPVTATIKVVFELVEGAVDVYQALNEPSDTAIEVAGAGAPALEAAHDYGSDDMLM